MFMHTYGTKCLRSTKSLQKHENVLLKNSVPYGSYIIGYVHSIWVAIFNHGCQKNGETMLCMHRTYVGIYVIIIASISFIIAAEYPRALPQFKAMLSMKQETC